MALVTALEAALRRKGFAVETASNGIEASRKLENLDVTANLFLGRVRAMLLNAVVNPVPWVKSAEARTAYQVGSADAVFTQFAALCQGAGPARCAPSARQAHRQTRRRLRRNGATRPPQNR